MQIEFCEKALGVVRQTRDRIVEETRREIELETGKRFFELLWKRRSFQDVSIAKNYSIRLTHTTGHESLGSLSAAERQLLALAFTLALHTVSGFDAPLFIDTPVARVSDEHRQNLGTVFASVGERKQIVLLLTPSEHSPEISERLDKRCSVRYALRLTMDEKETALEVL